MSWRSEHRIYAQHVRALFRAGSAAPVHAADTNVEGDVSSWSDDEIKTLIDEGRRQLDHQSEDLERVRLRAQVTLAIGLVLEGTAGSLRVTVSSANELPASILWIVGLVLVAWAVLGVAATAVVRADMQAIHASVLSHYRGDINRQLAADYAAIAPDGEKQVATRLTNLRLAVAIMLAGAAATLGAWLWADASQPAHREAATNTSTMAHRGRRAANNPRPPQRAHAIEPTPLALRGQDAARALGVSDETFNRYIRPSLPDVHLGSARIYPVAALARWLADRAAAPSAKLARGG
jgi:hypothetical protein